MATIALTEYRRLALKRLGKPNYIVSKKVLTDQDYVVDLCRQRLGLSCTLQDIIQIAEFRQEYDRLHTWMNANISIPASSTNSSMFKIRRRFQEKIERGKITIGHDHHHPTPGLSMYTPPMDLCSTIDTTAWKSTSADAILDFFLSPMTPKEDERVDQHQCNDCVNSTKQILNFTIQVLCHRLQCDPITIQNDNFTLAVLIILLLLNPTRDYNIANGLHQIIHENTEQCITYNTIKKMATMLLKDFQRLASRRCLAEEGDPYPYTSDNDVVLLELKRFRRNISAKTTVSKRTICNKTMTIIHPRSTPFCEYVLYHLIPWEMTRFYHVVHVKKNDHCIARYALACFFVQFHFNTLSTFHFSFSTPKCKQRASMKGSWDTKSVCMSIG